MAMCYGCGIDVDIRDTFFISDVSYCPKCAIRCAALRCKDGDNPRTALEYASGQLRRLSQENSALYLDNEIKRIFG